MAEWTPEAHRALHDYLAKVSQLARASGDDADEIVDGLVNHIVTEVNAAAGSVATAEHVARVLATVGAPEQVTGAADRPPQSFVAQTPPKAPVAAVAPTAPVYIQQTVPRSRTGCWIFAAVCLVVCLILALPVAGIIFSIAVPSYMRKQIHGAESAARESMRSIVAAELEFKEGKFVDRGSDDIFDYGSLAELAEFDLIDPELASGTKDGYRFEIRVIESTSPDGPGYRAFAEPIEPGRTGILRYYADESGDIRFTNDGTEPDGGSLLLSLN